MKRRTKIISAILLTITLLSGCGIRFGIESRRNNNFNDSISEDLPNQDFVSKNFDKKDGEEVNIRESMEGINNLQIEAAVSNIAIIYHEGKEVEVTGVLGKHSRGIEIGRASDQLKIEEKANKTNKVNSDSASNLIIKIPNSYSENLELTLGVGECNMEGLIVDSMDVKAGLGKLSIENVSFNKLNLESGLGDVNINTKQKTGEMHIEGGVGEINISLGDINGDLKYEGGMGNANIIIPEDSPVKINTSSGLGSANVSAKTSGENKYIFDISMGIGELNITN